jgi:hypothetical protein
MFYLLGDAKMNKKINKLAIIEILNKAWVIADSRATLSINADDVQIVMPFWDDRARVIIDDKEFSIIMVNDTVNPDLLTLGDWDLPRLNALLG